MRRQLATAAALSFVLTSMPALSQSQEPFVLEIAVVSSAFADGGSMPARYTCDGDGESPPLSWSNVPATAQSIAVVVDDPDAPRGTFVHWVVYNIPATNTALPDGAARGLLPAGAEEGKNGKGESGWTPLCPPWGRHHYHFEVYALRGSLVLSQPSRADLTRAMRGQILARGEIVGTYQRGAK
jgi:Raf kinase inhibitor-like YbhB/YbcL family protein